jgi:hypothetical protein
MRPRAVQAARREAPQPADTALGDLRFRALLGAEAWAALPALVRARFAKRFAAGQAVNYCGQVVSCELNPAGWLLAQACRLIGAPLPLDRGAGMAAVVTVTEHAPSGGQVWTRVYARRGGFPQVIHSAKQFAGPTGLEEYLGLGFGIALTVAAGPDRIVFASDHYFVRAGRLRLRLPRWLAPGALIIEHIDRGEGQFLFVLSLTHRWFGALVRQTCAFSDGAVPRR